MKKFLTTILLFFILFFLFDKLFIPLRNNAPALEVDKRLEVLLQGKMDADLLIFGSSVSAEGIIASILSTELKLKAYNLSYPGSNIDFHEYLLQQVLQNGNKKPKTVLLAIDDSGELKANTSINFRLERLYPLIKYPQVRKELNVRTDKNQLLSEFFVLYQLNKSNLDIRKRHFTEFDTILPCGSMPSYKTTNNFPSQYEIVSSKYKKEGESELLLQKFNSFVNLCVENNIDLVLVFPPKYRSRNKSFEDRIESLTQSKASYLIYDDQNPIYRNKDYFIDASHLNTSGAMLFSIDVVKFLKKP
jgi:hypothetical protein